jgi:hypothetical protein
LLYVEARALEPANGDYSSAACDSPSPLNGERVGVRGEFNTEALFEFPLTQQWQQETKHFHWHIDLT